MRIPLTATPALRPFVRPTLRTLTMLALIGNALAFGTNLVANGPDGLNLGHIIPALVVASIVALRFRWTPALGALLGGLFLVEGYIFLKDTLTQPDSAGSFAFTVAYLGTAAVALLSGLGALVQAYRAARQRPLVDRPAPRWVYPALLGFATLALGGILTTTIQAGGTSAGFTPEALASLPSLQARDYLFAQPEIKARVGETVVLRLDNADTSPHFLDIDELGVHTLMGARRPQMVCSR